MVFFIISFIFFSVSIGILLCPINLALQLTFLINLALLSITANKIIKNKKFNPFLNSILIFYFLFFIVAPIIQLSANNTTLLSGLKFDIDSAIYANILVFISYASLYLFFLGKNINLKKRVNLFYNSYIIEPMRRKALILSILITIFCLPVLDTILKNNILESTSQVDDKMVGLLINKFIMMIPFSCFLYLAGINHVLAEKKRHLMYLMMLIICIIILKNPLTEKRHALGPMYLTIIYYFFEKYFNNNKKYLFKLFFLFVIFFPLSSLATHSLGGVDERLNILESNRFETLYLTIYNHFLELHYDAWNILITVIDYVSINGLSFGYQLLGALFFFVPRSLWTSKPDGTGTTVVNNYVSLKGSEFSNISCPFPAEAFVNFGLIGIIFFSYLLVRYSKYLSIFITTNSVHKYFAIYFSFYLFFILRGDLMNSVAYYIGFVASYLFIVILLRDKVTVNKVTGLLVKLLN